LVVGVDVGFFVDDVELDFVDVILCVGCDCVVGWGVLGGVVE